MKTIALKLIDYGISFNYEHQGSQGEVIKTECPDMTITSKDGNITVEQDWQHFTLEDNETNLTTIAQKVEDIITDYVN